MGNLKVGDYVETTRSQMDLANIPKGARGYILKLNDDKGMDVKYNGIIIAKDKM